jgi:hypothetical protein
VKYASARKDTFSDQIMAAKYKIQKFVWEDKDNPISSQKMLFLVNNIE